MDKVAIVTGASRGIGRQIAINLAMDGYSVVINYNGNEAKALETLEECNKYSNDNMIYKCNVASFSEVEQMIKDIMAKYSRIDVLVNNAGITKDTLLLRMSEADFDNVIDINLKGAFNCIKHVSKIMIKQRSGKIVNLSSVVGVSGNSGQANYAASKAGVIGLTKSVAKELASRGINVNCVAPGYIDTDMTSVLSDDVKEKIKASIALNRLGNPSDIANVVSFLVSEKSSYITGQVINVCGGMLI